MVKNNNELKKHKKHDSIKWVVVFVLLAVLIVGMIGTILQVFTDVKPSEWFNQTTDESECTHEFTDGICSKCGKPVVDTMTFESALVTDGSDVIVNYYSEDYQLLETKTIKAGEAIPEYKEGCKQSYITKNTFVAGSDMANISLYLSGSEEWIPVEESYFSEPEKGGLVNLAFAYGAVFYEDEYEHIKIVSFLGLLGTKGFSFIVNNDLHEGSATGSFFDDGVIAVSSDTLWYPKNSGDRCVVNSFESNYVNAINDGLIFYNCENKLSRYSCIGFSACYDVQNFVVHEG